jgi:alanyl-tRNA synthetase
MQSADIRQSFVDFFADRGHRVVASAPLVPRGDPTLLFTNAGMVPFKAFFLGAETSPSPRAVTVQKCLRVSGKHNDLENVGPSPRHHTFFEMLGNFSFGDYFKAEAIRFAWELVTGAWGLAPAHLFATVFEEDDEAERLWLEISGLPAARVVRCGAADNFWAMGDTGPCGPCSEILVDRHPERPAVPFAQGAESGRYLEIWNLVFMQYDRDAAGEMHPLPNPSIDTGAGLERVAAVLEGVESNYESDLFRPLVAAAAELAGVPVRRDDSEPAVALRVIADHLRAVAFLLAGGVIPGNEGRGYVLRRLLRRAVRHGMRLGLEEPFLNRLLPAVGEVMGAAYPELPATERASAATLRSEEEKFLATLAAGARQMQEEIERARREGRSELDGAVAFRLYDTLGLPLEVMREIAEEERFGVDEAGFAAELEAQRERSRAATGEGQKRLAALARIVAGGATPFEGYDRLELEGATVLRLAAIRGAEAVAATALAAGETGGVVLDRTVFYAESGGQVGDVGTITWPGGAARVVDTQKDAAGTIVHFLEVEEGSLGAGAAVDLAVDPAHRLPTQRNHTATHLLHAALREVLGEGVRQAGSLVAPDRLRFDFTCPRPVTAEEVARVEARVNEWVLRAAPTAIAQRPYPEAIAAGAMALFGEKYGEVVRTVAVPGVSLELCGGCHVANTGEIGLFLITSERGIASGVRRVEAITGEASLVWVGERRRLLAAIEGALGGTPAERAPEEIATLRHQLKEREAELSRLRLRLVTGGGSGAGEEEREVAGIKLLVKEVPPAPAGELRNMADALRSRLGSGAVVLGSRGDGKVGLVAAVSPDLAGRLHAGDLIREVAARVGGSGGGRADFAQAGGKDPDRLPAALAAVEELVRTRLGA